MKLSIDKKNISGWGRYPRKNCNVSSPSNIDEILNLTMNNKSFIARGNGRSYGDAALNTQHTLQTRRLNNLLYFDDESGVLVAESGTLISDIIDVFLPRGWFPYVTPGTKYITLGGAISADVHGKNHHKEGSFAEFVNWIEILDKDGSIKRCSKHENPEMFQWTMGGMGLTGIILRCSISLRKVETGWINQKTIKNKNLKDTLSSFEKYHDSTYSVAWIDCLSTGKNFGRSVFMLGEHCQKDGLKNRKPFPKEKKQLNFRFNAPNFLLNNSTVSIFNNLYFSIHSHHEEKIVDWDSYFYPLDSITNWNKMYGSNGFFQFQCLLPIEKSYAGYGEILQIVQKYSSGSFLAVLKRFGKGRGYLSFPEEGFTLALDFKASPANMEAFKKMIDILKKYNGKIYFAKDSLLDKNDKKLMFPQETINRFNNYRNFNIESELTKRIKL